MGVKKIRTMSGALSTLLLFLPQAIAHPAEELLFGITIRNSTLEQRFVQTRNEEEPVATNIMNSDVQGTQTTTTETRLRILPDPGSLRFDLLSTGNVSSQTRSLNRQVMIDSMGQHHFEITKPLWFNGRTFLTQPGYGKIQASQAPRCVVSAVGATMPLLRPLSDRLAWEQVMRQQAEINQAVAEDVSRTVLPKIDRIVDEEFAQRGQQLANLQTQVESTLRTLPLSWVARSSQTSFSIAAIPQSPDAVESGFYSLPVNLPQLADGEDIALTVSDTVATVLFEHFVPGGLVLSDTQVEKASKAWNKAGDEKWSLASFMQLIQEIERNAGAEPTLFSIQTAKVNPIAIRFDRGDVCIETSFQILPKGAAPSGWIKTTWRIRGRGVSDDQWAVVLHQVDVADAENPIPVTDIVRPEPEPASLKLRIPSDRTFESNESFRPVNPDPDSGTDEPQGTRVASGTEWLSVVKNATQSLLKQIPAATLPMEFDVPAELPGSPKIRLVRIESTGGVLRATFRLVDLTPQP